jgi:hypothetical protein
MAVGRTDEQETPLVAKACPCRIRVWDLFGETHLGQRSYRHRVKGRTHDRTRSERQIAQKALALQGPSTHATTPGRGHVNGYSSLRDFSPNQDWFRWCTRLWSDSVTGSKASGSKYRWDDATK